MKRIFLVSTALVLFFSSCKKEEHVHPEPSAVIPPDTKYREGTFELEMEETTLTISENGSIVEEKKRYTQTVAIQSASENDLYLDKTCDCYKKADIIVGKDRKFFISGDSYWEESFKPSYYTSVRFSGDSIFYSQRDCIPYTRQKLIGGRGILKNKLSSF